MDSCWLEISKVSLLLHSHVFAGLQGKHFLQFPPWLARSLKQSRKKGRAQFMLLVSLSSLYAFGKAVIVIKAIEISRV